MNRKFEIDDMVVCKVSGVIGRVIKFYIPTSCDEQTMVVTGDGRKYHAPTKDWVKVKIGIDMACGSDNTCETLNPYGKYLVKLTFDGGKHMDKDKKCIDCAIWKSFGMDLRYCKHLKDLGYNDGILCDARDHEICSYFVEYLEN